MTRVRTEEELGEALRSNAESIEIEGDLSRKVIRIRATGDVAWLVASVAIAIAALAVIAAIPTGGTSAALGLGFAPAAVGVLGGATTITAIGVAVAAGGVAALNKLRDYREVSRDSSSIRLVRR